MLPRLVEATRTNDLRLSSRVVTGANPADWGLWNCLELDGEATLAAARVYGRLGVQTAVTTTKRQIVVDQFRHDHAKAVADSVRLLARAMGTDEYREDVSALAGKRPLRYGPSPGLPPHHPNGSSPKQSAAATAAGSKTSTTRRPSRR